MKHAVVALLAAAAMAALGILYDQSAQHGFTVAARLGLKGSATLVAALLAVYGASLGGGTPAWLLTAGIAACAVADVLLEKAFLAGMGCFALGHGLYIAAFLMMRPPRLIHLVVFVALAILAVFVAGSFRGRLDPPVAYLLYGLILSAMAALSLGQHPVTAVGACLFLLSDVLLVFRLAGAVPNSVGRVVMVCYYGGQYLLGLSTLFM